MVGLGISILVILFIYQLRKRRREMHRKLAGQREQISRDLHDNVGAQLTYIKGNIDWLIDGKGGLSHEEEMKKLEVVSDTSTNIMNDLRETIWVIKKEHIKLDELADRLKSYLQKQISFCPGIDIEIMEDIRKNYNFPPTESLNTYRICQEAIANIIRHAGATRIVMLIKAGKQWDYFFSISDNGEGFALQKDYDGHYGLLNMEERAKEIGAQLSIDSEPGKGTKVTLVKFS
jgi:signal transduction histidine kinase